MRFLCPSTANRSEAGKNTKAQRRCARSVFAELCSRSGGTSTNLQPEFRNRDRSFEDKALERSVIPLGRRRKREETRIPNGSDGSRIRPGIHESEGFNLTHTSSPFFHILLGKKLGFLKGFSLKMMIILSL